MNGKALVFPATYVLMRSQTIYDILELEIL